MVLEEGMKAHIVTTRSVDAEFLASRQLSDEDVARIFAIPPAVLGIGDRQTSGSAVEESRELVVNSLSPLAARIEAAPMRNLLSEADRRGGYYIRHDLEGMLRSDLKRRFEAYRIGREIGALSANDIRRRDNDRPTDNGDEDLRPANMVPLGTPAPVRLQVPGGE